MLNTQLRATEGFTSASLFGLRNIRDDFIASLLMSLIQTDEVIATCVMYMTDYIPRLNQFSLYRTLYTPFISSYSTFLSNPIDTYSQIKTSDGYRV